MRNKNNIFAKELCAILTKDYQNIDNFDMNIEKNEPKKGLKLLWIISLTLIPISLISYLYIFSLFFAGGLFLTDFEVINKTDTPLRFSPYGKISTGETSSLPIYFNNSPYFPKIKCSGFIIKPSESKIITYDTDDSFFEGIIIETDNLVKDLRQEKFEINDDKIIIRELQNMPDADKSLTSQVLRFSYKILILYSLYFIGMTNSFLLIILLVKRRRNKKYGTQQTV